MSKIWKISLLLTLGTTAGLAWGENKLTPVGQNAVLTGRLTASPECAESKDKRRPMVWISIGQTLIYQVEVPVNGKYEFHLVPGKYEVRVDNSSGCEGFKEIVVSAGKITSLDSVLAKNGDQKK